jgi:hypothetical protein
MWGGLGRCGVGGGVAGMAGVVFGLGGDRVWVVGEDGGVCC